MPEHPRTAELRRALQKCLPLSAGWTGTTFRSVTIRYAGRTDLLSGKGSRKYGGRWNPPGLFDCVYGSLEPKTALSEALGASAAFGIPPVKMRPRVFVAINLRVQAVLDVRDVAVLARLGVTRDELLTTNWLADQESGHEALTQALGRLAWEGRLEGILVPSVREPGGSNLVLFPGRRRKGSSWRIQGARDLP